MIDLKPFCSTDPSRFNIMQPWSAGEYSYATNGHIIVRVARSEDIPENDKAPTLKVFFDTPAAHEWMDVPVCKKPPDITCDSCHGEGILECNLGHQHECEDCNETGKVIDWSLDSTMLVGGVRFSKHYLAIIQGWRISPTKDVASWISTDGADGLLMPRRD